MRSVIRRSIVNEHDFKVGVIKFSEVAHNGHGANRAVTGAHHNADQRQLSWHALRLTPRRRGLLEAGGRQPRMWLVAIELDMRIDLATQAGPDGLSQIGGRGFGRRQQYVSERNLVQPHEDASPAVAGLSKFGHLEVDQRLGKLDLAHEDRQVGQREV